MKQSKLTSVKILEDLYKRFKATTVNTKMTLQKLTNRSIDLYLTDEQYKQKLETDTMEQIDYIEKKRGPFEDPEPAEDMFDEFGNYIGD